LTPSRQDADVLDRLLCGEHRALETYREWIERFGHDAAIEQIAEGHRKAAASLQQLLSGSDGMLTGNSSPWAIWERAQRSGKNTFDKAASFRAIREGEESAIENYVEALRDRRLDPACRNLIHDRLLPQAHQGLVLLVTA